MLGVAIICTVPVWWWNQEHGWVSAGQLRQRGGLNEPFSLHYSTFLDFFGMQAAMVSPLLFLALLGLAGSLLVAIFRKSRVKEGDLLLLILFFSVFLFYAGLAWHLRGEPNWPAVSYLTLIVVLSSRWKTIITGLERKEFLIAAYVLAWGESLLLYNTSLLPLSARHDPMGRAVGWKEIANHLGKLREEQHADVLIADAYKEASIFSFYLPKPKFIYTERHVPPANQYDFWPAFPSASPHCALWITGDSSPAALAPNFNTITFVEHVVVKFRGIAFREYTIYRCENR